ncbi:NAD(P)-dependent oxidoreductase [Aureimonas sp. ME7]|uniref:NAD(P)-dependent oxidoreductase n=1 Tax=Aureimonas sp. ME7 TaxID=2744252 RepID=UPI0015F40DBF|nr:NAD(P)-dependent oxidoreductase [Aureimonas sp. ME7]
MDTITNVPDIGFIGFGEAARAFVSGWRSAADVPAGISVAAFDEKVLDPALRSSITGPCEDLAVECAAAPDAATRGRSVVFSLVTADRARDAAEEAARHIEPGTLFLDCNSCAPSTKQGNAALIERAGGTYVDVAVMSPVHPARHKVPLLLSGAGAEAAARALSGLGMKGNVAGTEVGAASATKMLRSVMIKGFEALTAECVLAARRAGVEDAVLASLQASDPGFDWRARSAYNFERMMVHGTRRAAEMREVAATLRDLGLPDRMTKAAAEWQDEVATLKVAPGSDELAERADRVIERLVR